MNFRKIAAVLLATVLLSASASAYDKPRYATRGEVTAMLLNAADFYNPDLVKSDIIKGYEDGLLHEERLVTRAEALVMLSRAFHNLPELSGHNARTALLAKDFNDIPSWAEDELEIIFDRGLVAGTSEGVFSPSDNVTVGQMELFIRRVYSLYGTNPRDDFYASVNREKLEEMTIDRGNVVAGTLSDLQKTTHLQLNSIINTSLAGNYGKNTPERKIADFYKTVTDTKTRNKEGISPIKDYLALIDSVTSIGELTLVHNTLSKELCVQPFIGFSLTTDIDDSTHYMLYLDVITPYMNKDVYEGESKEKDAYIDYLTAILTISGENGETARENAIRYFEFEAALAENMLDAESLGAISKARNIFSYNRLCALFPDFDIAKVLSGCSLKESDRILVADIDLAKKFAVMYNQSNVDVLKTAAKLSVLFSWGNVLCEEFSIAETKLSNAVLGTKSSYSAEQTALQALENFMPEYIGELYVEKFFDEESKKGVEKMAYDIIDTYKQRIQKLSWMSGETKEKAIRKLDCIEVKIGYPDTFFSYIDNVKILSPEEGGTYFKNTLAIKKEAVKHYGNMQYMEKDRTGWLLYPYTVNACYEASTNDITFPAAILQAPLYDKDASYEENLGGIGYIIAHEISHAFDSIGAQYDENGNFADWWTEEDREAFDALCTKAVEFFDGYEAISGISTDGKLTLNENIADLGAVACVTQLAGTGREADYKALYTAMANSWAETRLREYAKYAAKTDFHSDPKVRINRVLVNFDEFYEAFGIVPGDGMYVPKEERLSIW